MTDKTKTLRVDYLARVEGEGALYIRYDDTAVHEVKLKIFEPPRFFEAFLQGRDYTEAPDITARICGICPVAYQMSAVHAMEQALGIAVDPAIEQLRRLLYCGEWIESHVLHMAMLHAPDFLHLDSAVEMASVHPQVVQQALALKKAGNAIVRVLGGREIHPINVRVGGFYKLPSRQELSELRASLDDALEQAVALTRWVATLTIPDFDRQQHPYLFVALHDEHEYPMNSGRLVSSEGLNIEACDFENHFIEQQVAHSNALHCLLDGKRPYFVGPMARFNLNFETLSPTAKQLAAEIQVTPPYVNPFGSILIRALEVVHAVETAMMVLDFFSKQGVSCSKQEASCSKQEASFRHNTQTGSSYQQPTVRAGSGYAITEAPRGILYHGYRIGDDGKIVTAKIIPPTSQNQKTIEDDLRLMLPALMQLSEDELRHRCEQAIRNYDPCISCATHFLKLTLEKGAEQQ
ncbi:Ni/Fe hydrogenase subunit alpha [Aestuariicella hydrocarbonica]|uniref:Ni/Fe hydrogenase subunit alpha n=1 Tax=Pseudomaricurvus hydrocarbonicus TaxID=1470433 RepID=A0A9E5MN36_9GAMM|nr:Ni/Fe hydrogenase subunit alpha [Aestuariicella hydrocarbonica]NHO67301.1 Ni/Fe hydrogenase subunit alpha [Aestuariicella hydrocarbonica]